MPTSKSVVFQNINMSVRVHEGEVNLQNFVTMSICKRKSKETYFWKVWIDRVNVRNVGSSFHPIFEQKPWIYPATIYLLKVSSRNSRTRREICSNLTIKKPELRQWRCSGVFMVNFEHISRLVLVFLLLTLNR